MVIFQMAGLLPDDLGSLRYRLGKLQEAEANWDGEAVRQMGISWKDEYLTLLLSLPMILAFIGTWGRDAAQNSK